MSIFSICHVKKIPLSVCMQIMECRDRFLGLQNENAGISML